MQTPENTKARYSSRPPLEDLAAQVFRIWTTKGKLEAVQISEQIRRQYNLTKDETATFVNAIWSNFRPASAQQPRQSATRA
jgi:hypothetical protein